MQVNPSGDVVHRYGLVNPTDNQEPLKTSHTKDGL